MAKRYPRDVNEITIIGKVTHVKLWDDKWPSLSLKIDDLYQVKVSIKKDGPFYMHHPKLKGRQVMLRGVLNSWESKGELKYGLKSSEGGVTTMDNDTTCKLWEAFLIGRIKQCQPWKERFMIQLGMGYKVMKTNEWKTRLARVSCEKEYPVGAHILALGAVELIDDILFVRADVVRRVD